MALRIYGNLPLKTVPGQDTRPTTGRVREALFNIWHGSIINCTWLDLCAGNGVMGAEALCRGAASVTGIEKVGIACRTIRHNWQQVAQSHQTYSVIRGDVLTWLPKLAGQQFQHIYFDPPYCSDLYQPVITAIAQHQLLSPGGELAVEHDAKEWEAVSVPGLNIRSQKHYSRTCLTFYSSVQKNEKLEFE
ncbi:MAG: 16S rRNA (guanine(966)-N(2))-methyltransferase RsmD [Leptolyngbya sp. SIO1D8]|nr:16S rRNA (guanine(966)-N(2))-methyltransferase RsmD [Leptolyngbya sp. SIO1D8]